MAALRVRKIVYLGCENHVAFIHYFPRGETASASQGGESVADINELKGTTSNSKQVRYNGLVFDWIQSTCGVYHRAADFEQLSASPRDLQLQSERAKRIIRTGNWRKNGGRNNLGILRGANPSGP
jgi:hypothetical protein